MLCVVDVLQVDPFIFLLMSWYQGLFVYLQRLPQIIFRLDSSPYGSMVLILRFSKYYQFFRRKDRSSGNLMTTYSTTIHFTEFVLACEETAPMMITLEYKTSWILLDLGFGSLHVLIYTSIVMEGSS